jgi:hypothetical protein
MSRMATRIASGLAAAGIATILSMAPAQAVVPAPPGCDSPSCVDPTPPTQETTPWLKIILGTAGGVAIAGAAAATVGSRNRRQQQAPTGRTPVAG